MNREQAIAWLRSVGRNANESPFHGESISITYGEPRTHGDITVEPGAVLVSRTRSGAWELVDPNDLSTWNGGAIETHGDLESAARGAHDYVERAEQTLRNARHDEESEPKTKR